MLLPGPTLILLMAWKLTRRESNHWLFLKATSATALPGSFHNNSEYSFGISVKGDRKGQRQWTDRKKEKDGEPRQKSD